MTELVLGTAQLGDGYGITNTAGRLDDSAAAALLRVAAEGGISTFDTALRYGDAEARLGRLHPDPSRTRIITKLTLDDVRDGVADVVAGSASRMRVPSVGVLLHRVEDLTQPDAEAMLSGLRSERRDGRVSTLGVSVYDQAELELALERLPDLDLVQIPANVADLRLLESPLLRACASRGVEVHVRSVFLQGLLLVRCGDLPAPFAGLRPVLEELDAHAAVAGVERISFLLGTMREHPLVDAVVVGAASASELRSIMTAWKDGVGLYAVLPAVDPSLLDPRRWVR